jgi:hypothetical protein
MATMTGNDPTGSTPPGEEPALSRQQDPDASQPAEDPGYLTVTGEAAAEDGSVAPIIGGLPAKYGSAWDIGAPLEDRGTGLAGAQGSPPDQASDEHTRGERIAVGGNYGFGEACSPRLCGAGSWSSA